MKRSMLLAAVALIPLSFATPAFAQDAVPAATPEAQPADAGVGDIVVTAQRRAENVQNVPIAITAIGIDFLEARDISSIDQLGAVAPNVKIGSAPSNSTIAQISIRGSVTINPAITWEPAVGLYLDGVYIAKGQGGIFDVADLERIEVLRGPQGTLYGRNALAGVVNLVLKKPTGELGGSFEASYGNYDYTRVRGVIDLPKTGIFSAKLAGQFQRRDGFIDVVPNPYPAAFLARPNSVGSVKTLHNYSLLGQLRAEPSDTLTFDYTFDYSNYDQSPDHSQLYSVNRNGDPRDIFDPKSASYASAGAFFPLNLYDRRDRQDSASIDGSPLYERSRTSGHALTATLQLGEATLKSISGYRRLRWQDSLDLDGSPLDVAFTQRSTRYHAFSQELQVAGTALARRLNYVLGVYYFSDDAEMANPLNFFGHGTQLFSSFASHTKAWAAYGQLDYKLTDTLTVTGGLRYTQETKDIRRFQELRADPSIPAGVPLPITLIDIPYGGVPDAKFHNLSPQATLRYTPSEGFNIYARWARGFKSGGFNGETDVVRAPSTDCPSGVIELCTPYKAETVDSFELGFKSRMLDRRLVLNVALFWDEHRNLQLSSFRGGSTAASVVSNAGSARIRGFEIESVLRPVPAITLNASFAYLDPKYREFVDFDALSGTVRDVSDNRAFPHAPHYTASGSVDWRVSEGGYGRLNLIGDVSYTSRYFTYPYALDTPSPSDQDAYSTRSPGQTVVNARAVLSEVPLAGKRAQVALWVKNLFGEDRPRNFIDFGPSFGGLTVAYFPDPRTVGATLGVKF